MLTLRTLPRSITHYIKQTTVELHTTIKLLNDKDHSSSSDSSDSSDSDSDKESQPRQAAADQSIPSTNDRLNALLQSLAQKSPQPAADAAGDAAKKEQKSGGGMDLSGFKLQGIANPKFKKMRPVAVKDGAKQRKKSKWGAPLQDEARQSQTVGVAAEATTKTGKFDLAIKSSRLRFEKFREPAKKKKQPYEEQLVTAAKDVAKTLGGDSSKTELELLSQVLDLKRDEPKSEEDKTPEAAPELNDLLSRMKIEMSEASAPINYNDVRQRNASELMARMEKRLAHPSVAESLLRVKSRNRFRTARYADSQGPELKVPHEPFGILKKLSELQDESAVRLTTWEKLEEKELKLATLSAPANVFEEMILWTEQGKLWKFPIDNEQGMEEEAKVHFTEHVFLERHLRDWCPRKGPIRHFMELVCIGLSKNPYLTVQEKIEHITWYKDYFGEREELLQSLGVLDDKAPPQTPVEGGGEKKQIEA